MPARCFILQVAGRPSADDLAGIEDASDRITLTTVLRVDVRDQAALQGLLHRIHDLGLSLITLHDVPQASASPRDDRTFEITVVGPVGELVQTTLCDYAGPIGMSSRYTFTDTTLMGVVLTRLLGRGAELEHATEQIVDDIPLLEHT